MVTKCLLNDVSARAEAARAGGRVGGFVSWTAAAVTVLAGAPACLAKARRDPNPGSKQAFLSTVQDFSLTSS